MSITVTHTLAPEVMDILKAFAQGAANPLKPVVAETAADKKVAKTMLKEAKPEAAEEATDKVSLETVKAKVQALIQDGKRDKVKNLLTEYGAGKLAELDKQYYAEFYKQICK